MRNPISIIHHSLCSTIHGGPILVAVNSKKKAFIYFILDNNITKEDGSQYLGRQPAEKKADINWASPICERS
ncbi:hypothetical protein HanRHA438_Chr02g0088551 [Helianthus annuus]|uniref:Uncharacterized protein n=1 Tax=Helianthus annuus TaxID=4232 RepID=A0A251VHA7_HELAN|nr:hypothetical protein HanXRQr2_Chr02g0077251 [Helianthus annuus]KAJ0605560.1 hypothetical protein HanHA300_Chr02g0064381 [Helianthus annuus]KAJ0616391.1 hypothetical protein HanIR_Chr02g0090071 [Helianthus annuus]KAJ0619575.1 hypothetical protein HanHA89_Chr02g0072831 [Helianthus annuus]KAJ0778034.1 hypothetical protein HanLR1_Chr02g0067251 [Helianthus annuus]